MIKIYRRLFLLPHCLRHIEKALATPLWLTTLGVLFASLPPFLSTLSSKLPCSCFPAHPLQPAWTPGSPPHAVRLCRWPSWLWIAGHSSQLSGPLSRSHPSALHHLPNTLQPTNSQGTLFFL